ncbi:4Fe-4S dicluster domain-containing protein [Bacteroidota bacterium]
MGTNGIKNNRRKFVKQTAALIGTLALGKITGPLEAVVFAAEEPKGDGPWWGIGIDIEKCIGCGMCAKACKIENDVPEEPFYFRSWVEQYTIMEDDSIKVISPNGGIDGFPENESEENIFKTFYVPKMCNACSKSPCTQVCPVGATFETPDGITLVDEEYCIGCGYCIQACPYGCRYLHPEKKVADKCTFCYHRLKKGLAPACMEVCPTEARIYGDLREKGGKMYNFLKEHNCQVLKPHLNTGSKLHYNGLSAEVR